MKQSGSKLLPIPVDADLKNLVRNAALRTRLSQADVMRTALRIGLPEVIKRLQPKTAKKLFNLTPWSRAELAKAYGIKSVDKDYDVAASIRGQLLPGS
jgi:hypothetical protein